METKTARKMNIEGTTFLCSKNVYSEMLTRSKQMNDSALFGAVDNSSHHYFGIVKIDNALRTIKNNNQNICEVLTTYPKRVYFDIDAIGINPGDFTLDHVFEIMAKHFGIDPDHLTISGYSVEGKTSYHVVATNLYLFDADDLEKLKQCVKYIKSLGGNCDYFDDKVYTLNRQMKCLYQSKPGQNIALPLWPTTCVDERLFFISLYPHPKPMSYFNDVHIPTATRAALKVDTFNDAPVKPLELPASIGLLRDLTDPRKILDITPCDNNLSHGHRWKVALFAYFNGISKEEYIQWFKRSNPTDERLQKVKAFWKNPSLKNPSFSISVPSMLKYLSKWYPELASDNHATETFVRSFELELPHMCPVSYIKSTQFEGPTKAIVINIPMGGGKTTATLQYLDENPKKSFVWLAPRQTLVQNTSHRMNEEFKIRHVSHMDVGKDKSKLRKADRLIICNQSLHHLDEDQRFDIVVIDEIETVLLSWLDEDTHGTNMADNFERFCSIMRNARKIILLDAFTTTKTIKLLNNLGIQNNNIQVYYSNAKPTPKKVVMNNDFDEIFKKIVDAYMRGEKSFIFYPYKKGTEDSHFGIVEFDTKIKQAIKAIKLSKATTAEEKLAIHEAESEVKSVLYYAESSAKNNLGNVNEVWAEADYILTTSSITVGVNYEGLDYHNVFLLASGATNNPRDVIQSSMRIRKPISKDLNLYFFDLKTKDIKKYPKYFHEDDAIYQSLVIENLKEIQAGFTDAFYKFCELANYQFAGDIKTLMDKRRKKKFVNDLYVSGQLIEYSGVPTITESNLEEYEQKVYTRKASVVERLAVDKFYFDVQFRNLDEGDRAFIWNTNSRQFFKGIHFQIFDIVRKDNGNPSDFYDVNFNELKVSTETIQYIKKHYSITDVKKQDWTVIKVINDAIGFNGISSKKDKRNKHVAFTITERFKTLYDLHLTKIENDQNARVKFIEEEEKQTISTEAYHQALDKFFEGVTDDDFIEVESDIGPHIICRKELPSMNDYLRNVD